MEDIGELNDQELKELLDNLSQQLSSGNMAQAVSKGQALKGKLAALSSETAELTKSLENLNQELAQAASSKTEQSGQSGTQGNGMGQGQGEGEQRCDSLDSEKLSQ